MVTFKLFKLFWGEEGEFHKVLLKDFSSEKSWKENWSLSCPWKGQSTKMEEQRQEAQGKKSSAASAAKAWELA